MDDVETEVDEEAGDVDMEQRKRFMFKKMIHGNTYPFPIITTAAKIPYTTEIDRIYIP